MGQDTQSCPICATDFTCRDRRQRYCSVECGEQAKAELQRERRLALGRNRATRWVCVSCGQTLAADAIGKRLTCSLECAKTRHESLRTERRAQHRRARVSPLRPFFSYYGAKWRLAPHYPPPLFDDVVEVFAGSAGYALHHHDRRVMLCDADPIITGVWRYLIAVRESEVLAIPDRIDTVEELDSRWPQETRWLVGFWLGRAGARPKRTASAWVRQYRDRPAYKRNFWGPAVRATIASQLRRIRHWRIVEGDYARLANRRATWFIDPPYRGRPGSHYRHGSQGIDYESLATWCRRRSGQVIVCEAAGADWMPFESMAAKSRERSSAEALWVGGDPRFSSDL